MAYVEGVKAEGEANPLVFHCTSGSGRVSHRSGSGWLNTLCAKPTEWSSFFTGTVHMLSKFVKFSFHTSVAKTDAKNSTRAGARVAIESCPAPTNAIPATNLFTACPQR